MKFRAKKSQEEEQPPGFDLAMKNTELKEEIKELKEKQNSLLRESLKHQYLCYRMKTESEKILQEQKASLSSILEKVEQGLKLLKEEESGDTKAPKTRMTVLKENPKQKNKLHTE
ncbi:hypothetical protein NEMIN01_1117 [Nematocida minor]|uniref:uncharacterized protein n=1 Tax=Nematocida minor TaxID=1912983 RepID=UPI00222058EC|nr:uncharacterized protein NEMIN01_1117 [Nematocida minor]KAI5190579.1 hypothetical protein NEMIN01_1117 [Nematocida minor]